MCITPYLDDFDADPETKRVLDVAPETTRVRLELDHFANGIIAKQIIELVSWAQFFLKYLLGDVDNERAWSRPPSNRCH